MKCTSERAFHCVSISAGLFLRGYIAGNRNARRTGRGIYSVFGYA